MLDGGQVDSVIFSAGVIAVDQEGEQGKDKQNNQYFGRGMVFHAYPL